MVFWFSQSAFTVAGTTIEAKIFASKQGITRVSIPPVGEIRAKTHKLPVGIEISVDRVTVGQMQRLASSNFSKQDLIEQAESELTRAGRRLAVRLLALAALGGLAAGLLLPGRNWQRVLVATLIGMVAVAVPGFIVVKSYDVKAWRQPKYSGMLATAPWLLGTIEEKLDDMDTFRAELRTLARNLHEFYARIEDWQPVNLGNGTIKVLHVSDIHNNPAALDLVGQVAKDFHIDMIIDTGDLTDLGTPMEASLISHVGSLGVPYVFVPGNHDSDAVIATLKTQKNVRVVDNGVVKVKGLSIFGAAEPAAYRLNSVPTNGVRLNDFAAEVGAGYRKLASRPDIVIVHRADEAKELIGLAPLILSGHTHQATLKAVNGTLEDDAGSTGAAGIRTFEEEAGVPYSLKIIYFAKRTKKATAVDSLTFSGVTRNFILERHLVAKDSEELKNSAAPKNLNISLQQSYR